MLGSDLNDLIVAIYDTIQNQSLWPEVLTRFADAIGARGCIVSEIEGLGDARRIVTPYVCTRYSQEQIQRYLDSFAHYEFLDQARYEHLSKITDAIDLIDQTTLAGDQLDEFLARPSVQRMQAIGVVERAGCLLDKDNTLQARFSVHFGKEGPGLTAEVRAKMAILLPHLAKAIELGRASRQLARTNRHLLKAMDRLRMGVCLLDRFGRIEAMNGEFGRQVDAYPTYTIDGNKRLTTLDNAAQKHLNDLLSDVMMHGRFGARPRKEALTFAKFQAEVVGSTTIGALCIEVAPLHRLDEAGTRAFDGAVIFSLDTTRPVPFDLESMRRRFGLTKAETTTLSMIGEGLSNNEIADRRSRSPQTINTQVKSVLSKTETSNRTQLVRLMSCFGADYLLPADDANLVAKPVEDR
ncbi:MAG: helix-turn-helix transcriptional regulator [Alphaproteobacteria bacterium]|nr:helix-turn-helix transcriptional regulator [Alphaproteobacteria bacterium]MCB9930561.1 helix-turn-helix transcriptional regulator [Alphaproteobacteria bacterium]